MNNDFNDYLDLVNSIDDDLANNNLDRVLKNVKYKVYDMFRTQKKYNINKSKIIKRLKARGDPMGDNLNTEIDKSVEVTDIATTGDNYSNIFENSNQNMDSAVKKEDIDIEGIKNKLIKKCYLSIAKKYHPDKTSDPSKIRLFKYAKKYSQDNDLVKILYIISESDIRNINLNSSDMYVIDDSIENVDKEIHLIKKSIAYMWNKLSELQKISFITNLKINNET